MHPQLRPLGASIWFSEFCITLISLSGALCVELWRFFVQIVREKVRTDLLNHGVIKRSSNFEGLGAGKSMCSEFGEGHSAENVEKPCFSPKARDRARLSKLVVTNSKPQAPCSLLQRLNPSAKPAPAWPRRPVLAYIKELHWLIQRASVVAQLPKHRRTPLQARGPRGSTDSYFRTWAGFYSASLRLIISARHGRALTVL